MATGPTERLPGHPDGMGSHVPNGVDVSIVIVNWNSRDYLEKCLLSIARHTRQVTHEVVVIDAGSYDGSDQLLRDRFPHVKFVQSGENAGFAKSNNRAHEVTEGKWLLFLNPDTEFLSPVADVLCAEAQRLSAPGLLGARLMNSDGTPSGCSVHPLPTITNQVLSSEVFQRWAIGLGLWADRTVPGVAHSSEPVDAVPGTCFMIERGVFEGVNGFSEDYFMYAEDFDLCHKVKSAGYQNYYVPDAVVTHHGGASSSRSISDFAVVMQKEANWRFFRKTRGTAYARGYQASMLAAALARITILTGAMAVGPFRRQVQLRSSRRKWIAVARWALGIDDVVRHYYPDKAIP